MRLSIILFEIKAFLLQAFSLKLFLFQINPFTISGLVEIKRFIILFEAISIIPSDSIVIIPIIAKYIVSDHSSILLEIDGLSDLVLDDCIIVETL